MSIVQNRIETVQEPSQTEVADLTTLPNLINTWKTLLDETKELQSALREKKTRLKALDEMILRRKAMKESLGQKNLVKLLGEAMKSEQKAADAMKYIEEHRGSKVKESLVYENDV